VGFEAVRTTRQIPWNISSHGDGDSMFLRNVDIYLQVDTTSKPRKTLSSSLQWEPKI
jgi:hypothetical protein